MSPHADNINQASAPHPLVRFSAVGKRFGDFIAVEPMNLSIYEGEFLAIMGSSGCGKTTTLRMLAGLEVPSEGDIHLNGQRINDLPIWQRDTPLVWQNLALFPFLSVHENVEFGLKMRQVAKAERTVRVNTWLERLQIAEFADRNVAHLSGGQRQRVALARSLVTEPRILLLDEPLSALDAHLKVRMQSMLVKLQRELAITFVYVTHSQSEAFSMADRVVIMSRGRIEQIGKPLDIYRAPRSAFVAEFLGSNNIFSGTVQRIKTDCLVIETPEGVFSCPLSTDKTFKVGDSASFVVADDQMQLSNLSSEAPGITVNGMQARIVGEEFVGATAIVHLESDGARKVPLKAQKSHHELARLNRRIGTTVYLSWRKEAAHILQTP